MSVEAWSVADTVLHDPNSNMEAQYFCAQTLRTKVRAAAAPTRQRSLAGKRRGHRGLCACVSRKRRCTRPIAHMGGAAAMDDACNSVRGNVKRRTVHRARLLTRVLHPRAALDTYIVGDTWPICHYGATSCATSCTVLCSAPPCSPITVPNHEHDAAAADVPCRQTGRHRCKGTLKSCLRRRRRACASRSWRCWSSSASETRVACTGAGAGPSSRSAVRTAAPRSVKAAMACFLTYTITVSVLLLADASKCSAAS